MCVVSNVSDYFNNRTLPKKYPNYIQWVYNHHAPSREEFEALKRDVEELKKLLEAAKVYDEKVGEPHCEAEEKVNLIKKIAEIVGVDLKGVLG